MLPPAVAFLLGRLATVLAPARRTAFYVVLASLFMPAVACAGGGLTRQAAEALIAKETKLIARNGPGPVQLRLRSPFVVSGDGASPQAVFTLKFVERLTGLNLIAPKADIREGGGRYGYTFLRQYQLVANWHGLRQGPNESGAYGHERYTFVFDLATPKLIKVTGITQQGNEALAEVQIGLHTTPMYDQLLPAVQDLLAECPSFGNLPPDPCRYWLTPEALAVTKTVNFAFRKFDDGWRLVAR